VTSRNFRHSGDAGRLRHPRAKSCGNLSPHFGGRYLFGKAMNKPNQRLGSVSNSHVGNDFEAKALEFFAKKGIALSRSFPVKLGVSKKKKVHCFDLGTSSAKIIVECKSHRWTAGARVPSAKMAVWNEAMYYFHLAPRDYRKILFVLHDRRDEDGESLLRYYKRTYSHMIPDGVEFLEWDAASGDVVKI
jgi:hypothetical protein